MHPPRFNNATDEIASVLRSHGPGGAPSPAEQRAFEEFEARLFGRPLPAVQLGRYAIGSRLGAGGMGVVFKATDPVLQRTVAIKLVALGGAEAEASHRTTRLRREARALAHVDHPNVVDVFDVGEYADASAAQLLGVPPAGMFIAMEFVEGTNLRQWTRRMRPSPRELLRVYLHAAEGLAAAHAQGLVHRDFKPSNVLVGAATVKITDFGLALARPQSVVTAPPASPRSQSDPRTMLTRSGTVIGTPAYAAPEQMEGKPVGPRADQYSFCVALYEALCDERPTPRDASGAASPTVRGVPPNVWSVLHRGLQRDPERRFASMADIARALRRAAHPRRRRWPLAIAGLGAALAIAPLLTRSDEACAPDPTIWSTQRSAEIEAAFASSESPMASATWIRAEPRLSNYARAWNDAHVQACALPMPPAQQAQRRACVWRTRETFEHLVARLRTVSSEVLEHALDELDRLPDPGRCSHDLERPLDPALAAEHDVAERLLARARTIGPAAPNPEARQLRALVQRAEAWQAWRLQSLALDALASDARGRGNTQEAAVLRESAYLVALEHGYRPEAFHAARALSESLAIDGERMEDASRWLKRARAVMDAGPADPRWAGLVASQEGLLHFRARRLDRAIASFEEALEVFAASEYPSDATNRATAHARLGMVLSEAGALDQGGYHLRAALELTTQRTGPEHPAVVASLNNLTSHYDIAGQFTDALRSAERALALCERLFGPDDPRRIPSLTAAASVLRSHDRDDDARALLRDALRIAGVHGDAGSKRVLLIRLHVAEITPGAAGQRRLLEVAEAATATLGRQSGLARDAYVALGTRHYRRGEHRLALAEFERAIDDVALDEPKRKHVLYWYGAALAEVSGCKQALPWLRRSLAVTGEGLLGRTDAAARLRVGLCLETVDPAQARELIERAADELEHLQPNWAPEYRLARRWLLEHPPG